MSNDVRLIVHGGAWDIPADLEQPHLDGVRRAVADVIVGLQSGQYTALDAVEAAVRIMEADPTYDAGRGSFLNENGEVEMDASIMDGRTLNCGAVAAIQNIMHPITAARLVMEKTAHVLLVGTGAQAFIRQHADRVPEVLPEDLLTEQQKQLLQQFKEQKNFDGRDIFTEHHMKIDKKGTVGAVARDVHGNLAAATSTGGIPLKKAGRVGDSPLIGAGTYADNTSGGASCTGWGEAIIKVGLAKNVCDRMENGCAATEAITASLMKLQQRANGHGGVIAIKGATGEYGFSHNTPKMAYAYWDYATGTVVSGIQAEL